MLAVFQASRPGEQGSVLDETRALRLVRRRLVPLHNSSHVCDGDGARRQVAGSTATEAFLGDSNASGIAFFSSATSHFETYKDGDFSIFFSGQLEPATVLPGGGSLGRSDEPAASTETAEDDCNRVADVYRKAVAQHSNLSGVLDFSHCDLLEHSLTTLKGRYAFVIYDRHWQRIVAARDSQGSQKLYWGRNTNGDYLYFSTDQDVLDKCVEQAEEFPANGIFISKQSGEIHQGTLNLEECNSRQRRTPRSKRSFGQHDTYFEAVHADPATVAIRRRRLSAGGSIHASRLSRPTLQPSAFIHKRNTLPAAIVSESNDTNIGRHQDGFPMPAGEGDLPTPTCSLNPQLARARSLPGTLGLSARYEGTTCSDGLFIRHGVTSTSGVLNTCAYDTSALMATSGQQH